MKYFIGTDHAGIDIKDYVKELFEEYLLNQKIEQIINLDNLN